jgi:hypothetical protein
MIVSQLYSNMHSIVKVREVVLFGTNIISQARCRDWKQAVYDEPSTENTRDGAVITKIVG